MIMNKHTSNEINQAIRYVLESFKYKNLKGDIKRKYSDHFVNKVIDLVSEKLAEKENE